MAASFRCYCRPKFEETVFIRSIRKSFRKFNIHDEQLIKRYFSVSRRLNEVRVRFAPSPTGLLHLGGLRTALYNFLFAKSRNGSFLLRIEDTDRTRMVPGSVEHLQDILEWAGIVPDEGPSQGGDFGPYVQSERLQVYNDNIKLLLDNGRAYPCFCTARRLELMRKEAAQRGEPSKYDNRCRHLTPEQIGESLEKKKPFVIRLKLKPTPEPWDDLIKGSTSHDIFDIEGDPILLKSDGYPTYHFANVVDDHYMKITHVLRGSEWLSSTPKHILLYKAFGWSPPEFGHLPLIVNPDGTKLSKRQGDVDVQKMKDSDHFPESVLSYVTSTGGGFVNSTQGLSLQDMCDAFDLSLVRKQTGRLDPNRLKEVAIHNLHAKAYSDDTTVTKSLVKQLQRHVDEAYNDRSTSQRSQDGMFSDEFVLDVIRWGLKDQRVSVLRDFLQPELSYIWSTPSRSQALELVAMETDAEALLKNVYIWLDKNVQDLSVNKVAAELKTFVKEKRMQPRQFFHFMRKALTGDVQGPPVAEMISVLGKTNVALRLESAIRIIQEEQKS